jgi:low affinity Fe/Cu permease
LGRLWPVLRVVGYLAAGNQHGDHNCHVSQVFLIQSTQSRDTQALHLKLDELIRVDNAARNSLLNLEEMSEADIEQVKTTFRRLIGPSEAFAVSEAV